MTASPFSVAPTPPVAQVPSADHSAVAQSAHPPVAAQPPQPASQPPPQDTVDLISAPIAKSLNRSGLILARIDEETAAVAAGARASGDPHGAAAQGTAGEPPPKAAVPAPYRSSQRQEHDTPDPQKQAATSGLIPMQVMQGKTKALAQSGATPAEIALELHLDLRTVEEYLAGSSGSAATQPGISAGVPRP